MDASPNHDHPQVLADRAFAALIREARTKPFVWGTHDCVLFANAAVKARTGRDALAELGVVPAWKTASEAASAIEGAGGFRAALSGLFGNPVAVLQARVGDVALIIDDGREMLAVVHSGLLLAPSALGLAALPQSAAVSVWRVTP